jgi:hypothetical protein
VQLVQQALLSTVDRILSERGDDPSIIDPQDKIAFATQLVQLCMLHESQIRRASEELAQALGSPSSCTLMDLAATARMTIETQRNAA